MRCSFVGSVFCLKQRTAYVFLFQAEDGVRCLVRSRGLGDVYQRQARHGAARKGVGR